MTLARPVSQESRAAVSSGMGVVRAGAALSTLGLRREAEGGVAGVGWGPGKLWCWLVVMGEN